MECIYCGRKEFDLDKKGIPMPFSKEHILPSALVGGLEKNEHFIIDNVHEYCNNIVGMFIDAPAIKNWIVSLEIADNATKFVKIEDNPILPLRYIGKVNDLAYENKICELWLGPTGASIYHFHEPYPDEGLPAMVGVPPSIRNKKIDEGFAFLFIPGDNEVWYPTIFYSFINAFKKSKMYFGNGNTPPGGAFSDIPKELVKLHELIKSKSGTEHKCEIYHTHGCEVRFLAKIALGIGHKLFGDTFSKSEEAITLRKFMWAKDAKDREGLAVHGTGFIKQHPEDKALKEFFGWEGGHVLAIVPAFDLVGIHLSIYNSVNANIRLGDMREEYKKIIGNGICYVIIPGLKKIVGPIKIIDFLSHKLDMGEKHPELSVIEEELEKCRVKPPFNRN